MPNIYKTFTQTEINNKVATPTTSAQNQKIADTLAKFVTLFKAKHL